MPSELPSAHRRETLGRERLAPNALTERRGDQMEGRYRVPECLLSRGTQQRSEGARGALAGEDARKEWRAHRDEFEAAGGMQLQLAIGGGRGRQEDGEGALLKQLVGHSDGLAHLMREAISMQ
jgi:hypothetical protein